MGLLVTHSLTHFRRKRSSCPRTICLDRRRKKIKAKGKYVPKPAGQGSRQAGRQVTQFLFSGSASGRCDGGVSQFYLFFSLCFVIFLFLSVDVCVCQSLWSGVPQRLGMRHLDSLECLGCVVTPAVRLQVPSINTPALHCRALLPSLTCFTLPSHSVFLLQRGARGNRFQVRSAME